MRSIKPIEAARVTEISVKRLPRDHGPAGWNALLPPPAPPVRLEGKQTADWLVIGAGFAGLAAARRLSQICPGDCITVLEAKRVGDGPAGRNSGFMIDLPHDLSSDDYGGAVASDVAQTENNRAAIAFARAMAEDFDLPQEAFSPVGKINGAATASGESRNRSYAAHLSAMGEGFRLLDADEMREITGLTYYRSGLFTPGTAMIQPAMFVRGVANGLRSNRLGVYEESPVVRLERDKDWIATTPSGEVRAPRVILAVNGHLNSFGFSKGRLMHVFTYASMTRELSPQEHRRLGGQPDWGITPADPMGTTVRRISGTGGDRLVVRNRFTYDPSMEVNDRRIERVGKDHDRAFRARFPMLKDVEMEFRWGGRLCLSLNGVQVVGELDEGLFSACCQNGLGTTKGTLAGMVAADLATGVDSPAARRSADAPAPRRLPPEPLSRIGATMRLRWGEICAGREL
ncbi:MAG: FAD-binding oxidoreductase [Pseudomonadota bacterium]